MLQPSPFHKSLLLTGQDKAWAHMAGVIFHWRERSQNRGAMKSRIITRCFAFALHATNFPTTPWEMRRGGSIDSYDIYFYKNNRFICNAKQYLGPTFQICPTPSCGWLHHNSHHVFQFYINKTLLTGSPTLFVPIVRPRVVKPMRAISRRRGRCWKCCC